MREFQAELRKRSAFVFLQLCARPLHRRLWWELRWINKHFDLSGIASTADGRSRLTMPEEICDDWCNDGNACSARPV